MIVKSVILIQCHLNFTKIVFFFNALMTMNCIRFSVSISNHQNNQNKNINVIKGKRLFKDIQKTK